MHIYILTTHLNKQTNTADVCLLHRCALLARSLTQHDDKYLKSFWDLVKNFGYARNALNAKIDCPVEDNHSDNELLFLTYHILFYALNRLPDNDQAVAHIRTEVSWYFATASAVSLSVCLL